MHNRYRMETSSSSWKSGVWIPCSSLILIVPNSSPNVPIGFFIGVGSLPSFEL